MRDERTGSSGAPYAHGFLDRPLENVHHMYSEIMNTMDVLSGLSIDTSNVIRHQFTCHDRIMLRQK